MDHTTRTGPVVGPPDFDIASRVDDLSEFARRRNGDFSAQTCCQVYTQNRLVIFHAPLKIGLNLNFPLIWFQQLFAHHLASQHAVELQLDHH